MKIGIADQLIDSIDFVKRQANQPYSAAIIPMRDKGYQKLVGKDFIEFFTLNPVGEDIRYVWTTARVDQLVNLKIWAR